MVYKDMGFFSSKKKKVEFSAKPDEETEKLAKKPAIPAYLSLLTYSIGEMMSSSFYAHEATSEETFLPLETEIRNLRIREKVIEMYVKQFLTSTSYIYFVADGDETKPLGTNFIHNVLILNHYNCIPQTVNENIKSYTFDEELTYQVTITPSRFAGATYNVHGSRIIPIYNDISNKYHPTELSNILALVERSSTLNALSAKTVKRRIYAPYIYATNALSRYEIQEDSDRISAGVQNNVIVIPLDIPGGNDKKYDLDQLKIGDVNIKNENEILEKEISYAAGVDVSNLISSDFTEGTIAYLKRKFVKLRNALEECFIILMRNNYQAIKNFKVKLDMSEYVSAKTLEYIEGLKARRGGLYLNVMSYNEVREILYNLPPKPNGDQIPALQQLEAKKQPQQVDRGTNRSERGK